MCVVCLCHHCTIQQNLVGSVLAALSLLALLGIRYPLKMLPLLLFELLWKVLWVAGWGLPLWSSGQLAQRLGPDAQSNLVNCLVGIVLVPLVLPWGYLLKQYVRAPGDRWGKRATPRTPGPDLVGPIRAGALANTGALDG